MQLPFARGDTMSVKKKFLRALLLLVAVLLLLCGGEVLRSKYALVCRQYTLTTSAVEEAVTLVQLTDLHNSSFGSDNSRLLALVEAQNPDLILVTGDLVTASVESTDVATSLLAGLTELAPVYVSMGNHEEDWERLWGGDLTALFTGTGATVLDESWVEVTVHGQTLRLGGIYGYCLAEEYLKYGEARQNEVDFLKDFQDTAQYTVLLCHIPYAWTNCKGLEAWEVDCILTGHTHGGQVILPWVGGLYAPDYGWWAGDLRGVRYSQDGTSALILSSGLGSSSLIPRFGNTPEVVVITLEPEG